MPIIRNVGLRRFGTSRVVIASAVALVVAFTLVLRLRLGGEFAMRAVDDLGQSLAAALGALGCAYRARRSLRRWRLSWNLIAAALIAWSAGELIWSYYELIARRETPFPSFADLGYLLFPALALPGLLVRPSVALSGRGWVRVVLDGAMIAGSLFNLSWATALGQVYHSGGPVFSFAVSLAYPASDLMMLTVAVVVLAHARVRAGLPLMVLGLVSMSVADSGFSYLTVTGRYATGSIVDIAWFAAFLCLGVAGVISERGEEVEGAHVESPVFLAVPYVCVFVGGVAEAIVIGEGRASKVTLIVQGLAIVALLARQLLTVLDNRSLVLDVVAQQAELRFRAFHDALTGLANRALFQDRVDHALQLHARDHRPVSLLYCDLDDFKTVNDSLGHDAGDTLLVAVAQRLVEVTRPGDTVARLGGDEFAILLEDSGDVEVLSERVLAALARPVDVGGRAVPPRVSIGTTSVQPGDPAVAVGELLKRADLAMYAAKRSGKGSAVPFSAALRSDGDELDLRLALMSDIDRGAVRTAFQPITLVDGRPYALEALARWRHGGIDVPPARFIPLAERIGALADLDLLMIRNALDELAPTGPHGPRLLMSVNLGASVLHRPDLPDRVAALLDEFAVDPARLVFEVSETEALEEPTARAVLGALCELGAGLAVDDFGMGYSNLSRLFDLAPSVVKLDMSLVRPLVEQGASTRLVGGIIDLAHDLGALVVGEGVETSRQLLTLRELGCDAVQGYYIGRPAMAGVPVDAVVDVA